MLLSVLFNISRVRYYGRHWLRVELSSTLLKFRTALTWQLWKRRPNSVWAQAT